MKAVIGWLDWVTGGDRATVRALILVLAIPILVIAAERTWNAAFNPEPPCVFCLTDEERDKARQEIEDRVRQP